MKAITQLNRTRDSLIQMKRLPLRRRWEQKTEEINGTKVRFYFYVSDFVSKDHRVTHVLIYANGNSKAGRYITEDLILPMGIFPGVQQAKLQCEKDTKWLDLCAPARDEEKATFLAAIGPKPESRMVSTN